MDAIVQGVAAGCIGLAALTAGGVWAAIHPPTGRSKSLVQHLAAGTVFAGLVVDVFRRLLNGRPHATWLIAGLILGLVAMMLIRAKGQNASGSTLGLTIIADVITDGLLMGLSILSGGLTGFLFVAALVPEMTLLGVTVAQELGGENASRFKKIGVQADVEESARQGELKSGADVQGSFGRSVGGIFGFEVGPDFKRDVAERASAKDG